MGPTDFNPMDNCWGQTGKENTTAANSGQIGHLPARITLPA
jgi:hypothetical protein